MPAYPAVERAELAPAQCLFTKSHRGPFLDMLRDFDFDHVGRMYVQVEFAKQLGVLAGLPSLDEVASLKQKLAAVSDERDELREEVESLREFEQAATYTVEHMGQKVRRKPGPKAKEPAAA